MQEQGTRCHSGAAVGALQPRSIPVWPGASAAGKPRAGGRQAVLLSPVKQGKGDSGATGSGFSPHVSQGQEQQVLQVGTEPPELVNNLPASMALCTGVLTSDLLARWAEKEGGRAR